MGKLNMKDFDDLKILMQKELHHQSSTSVDSSCSADSKTSRFNDSIRSYHRPPLQVDENERSWSTAASRCDLPIMKEIYCKDKDVIDKKDYFTGYAAAHWASKRGREDILDWLYDNHADINVKTNGGYTSLHLASMHGQDDIIKKLILDFDADIDIRDHSGRKPSHYLKSASSKEIRNILQATTSSLNVNEVTVKRQNSISGSKSMPSIIQPSDLSRNESIREQPKKKRSLSITQSFKHRRRAYVEKRDRADRQSSPNKETRSQSLNADALDGNKLTVDRKISLGNKSPDLSQTKSFASENVINGYACYLTDTKYRKKLSNTTQLPRVTEQQQWNINTWV